LKNCFSRWASGLGRIRNFSRAYTSSFLQVLLLELLQAHQFRLELFLGWVV